MNTLRVEALRSLADVAPFRGQIDALNLASRRPDPFSTLEYIETFVHHDEYHTKESELLFLAVFDGDTLAGYLPLRKHWDRLLHIPYRRIDVLVSHDTDRPHVVARPEDESRCASAIYDHLLRREHGWSFLELAMQDEASALGAVPHASRFYVRRSPSMPNTTVPLPFATFADYFATIPSAHRKNMARLARRLLAAGKVEAVTSTDPRARLALLDLYLDLEKRSWKQAAHAGIARDPERVEFFRALCAPDQPLEIAFDFILLDDLPIAGFVSGAFGKALYGFEMTFDEAYEELAPGHLSSLLVMRRAIEGGYTAFNFNGNYTYYKARMGGVVSETSAVQIYRVGTIPWLKARGGEIKRRLRPPEKEDGAFNPERRKVEKDQAPPVRDAERERARAMLAALEAEGARIDRLSGKALEKALPFNTKKDQ